ncbi:MAG: hypothetical protein ACI9QV_001327 [Methylophagaceae bacterium]|jgi:hypothetical protein
MIMPPSRIEISARIPCRGCFSACPYISKCEGKPWRMSESTIEFCLEQAESNQVESPLKN